MREYLIALAVYGGIFAAPVPLWFLLTWLFPDCKLWR